MGKQSNKKNNIPVKNPSTPDTSAYIIFFLLLGAIFIVPIAVRLVLLDHASPIIVESYLDSGTRADFFSYHKLKWLCFFASALILVFAIGNQINKTPMKGGLYNALLGLLTFWVLMSGFLAEYKTISFLGQFDRHEGTLALLSYFVLFLVASNTTFTLRQVKLLLGFLIPFVVINFLLGFLHLINYDTLRTKLVSSLLIPSNLPISGINPGSYISSSLSNPDFISGIGSVLAVLFMVMAVFTVKLPLKIIWAIVSILAYCIILTSYATSGFFALVVSLPIVFVVILFSKYRKKALLTLGIILLAYTLVFPVINNLQQLVYPETVGFFVNTIKKALPTDTPAPISPKPSRTTQDDAYPEFKLPSKGWSPGTGRLYIWSETLKLIPQKPIFGYGMDTFSYYFPQDDPKKNSGLYDSEIIVDKAHNMYLGLGLGAGIPYVLLFLTLAVYHLFNNFKLLKRRIETERQAILASLFVGWFAYMIQGLFNDSVVGSSAIFWILFGLSVSLLVQELQTPKPEAEKQVFKSIRNVKDLKN